LRASSSNAFLGINSTFKRERKLNPNVSIHSKGLGKKYLIGHEDARERYTALRDALVRKAKRLAYVMRGRQLISGDKVEEFWALRDISFEVKRGEVLGIIGRNGAGKSTLLKILSRITEPSEGRVTITGRVASLLEVGTGFHPELTGRQNIFLNGAILGMTRAEIRRKFDDIVTFADVERFLDTPVKRYSSGMYVRLAFSVAAHLEPEILIVDEVLSVGDVEFQKKCLATMHSISMDQRRTVLFVSHNLSAVQSLCDRAILLDSGKVIMEGASRSVIARYLANSQSSNGEKVWNQDLAPGNGDLALRAVRVLNSKGEPSSILDSDQDGYVELDFSVRGAISSPWSLCVGFDLMNSEGATIFRTYQTDLPQEDWPPVQTGGNRWRCKIPKGLLICGDFQVSPRIGVHNVAWIVHEDAAVQFRVNLTHGVSPLWNALTESSRPGLIAPILDWKRTNQ
jgi:lipopolysaccharide transport system ATP-binding protein